MGTGADFLKHFLVRP